MQGLQDRMPRVGRYRGLSRRVSRELFSAAITGRWRCSFFGRIHEAARLASFAPRVANAIASGPAASLIRRMLGFHPERDLPRFATMTFRRWFRKHPLANPSGGEVLLFPDTFSNFFEPEVAIAATQVIERAGFRVRPARIRDVCCARPLYEQGMLDAARLRMLGYRVQR